MELTQWFKLFYNQNIANDSSNIVEEDDQESETIYWLPKDEIIESLKSERDFYYSKLRELELLMGNTKLNSSVKEAINSILHYRPENVQ